MVFVLARIFFVLTILMFSSTQAFAQNNEIPFLSVKTDDNHYDEGDTIVVSGEVQTVIVATPIILQVWSQGNMIDVAQFFPAQDGSYSHTIIAEKPLWKNEGEYVIRISYGTGNIAESPITFSPSKEYLETTDSYEVQIPNGGTFDLEYTINGGAVQSIILDPTNFTLLIQIDAPDEGKIALKIPRNALDAKKSDIQDEKFIVLIDDIQVPYEEKENNSQIRFITINFEEGDSKIAIIGTFIVPEFGVVAGLILLSGIIITIGFSKNRLQLKY